MLDGNPAKNTQTSYVEKAPRFFFFLIKMKNNLKVCSFNFFYSFLLSYFLFKKRERRFLNAVFFV